MSDILPYLNVFPTVDFESEESLGAGELPEDEGISGNAGITPEAPEETEAKVYETDEYVAPDDEGSGVPEEVPGEAPQEAEESAPAEAAEGPPAEAEESAAVLNE